MPISKRLEVRHRQPLALDFRIHLVAIQITPSLPFSLGAEFIQRKQFPQPFKNMNFIFCCTIFVSARKKVCLRQSVTALEGSKGLYSTFLVKSVLRKDWDFFLNLPGKYTYFSSHLSMQRTLEEKLLLFQRHKRHGWHWWMFVFNVKKVWPPSLKISFCHLQEHKAWLDECLDSQVKASLTCVIRNFSFALENSGVVL